MASPRWMLSKNLEMPVSAGSNISAHNVPLWALLRYAALGNEEKSSGAAELEEYDGHVVARLQQGKEAAVNSRSA